ncbi:MAG: LacI family transcriptional regulator [Frondihabitans sp.]|nr:LacI family transcriptional regulator [Frondihabitans sp.]
MNVSGHKVWERIGSGMTAASEGERRPATIYDVARKAGVSHETVSRVLRDNPAVKPKNRERVEAALLALHYRPNATAKALATRRSRRIGAMVYDLREAGPGQFVEGATEAAREAGYLLDIVSVRSVANGDVDTAVALLNQPDLAGVIAFTPTDQSRDALAKTTFRIPVFFETEGEDDVDSGVVSLNAVGVGLVVDHLVSLGHSRILHLAGPDGWVSARNRSRAYERGMIGHGLVPLPIVSSASWSAASGYEAARLIDGAGMPTAIIAGNDQIAVGLLLALHERGISVPEDVSVVGFDDIPESAFTIPRLTTVHIDFAQAGLRAVRSLVAQIEGDGGLAADDEVAVSARLVVRSSTATRS